MICIVHGRDQRPTASSDVRVTGRGRGVTLGAAGTELDQVIVRLPSRAERPVEVLAVVEVKRNLNDLAHGFRRRQDDLAWLTGHTANYDPRRYRTRQFPTGHFDKIFGIVPEPERIE